MTNIQKLVLPMWTSLDINSIQPAISKWQNLQTLIIHPFISIIGHISLRVIIVISEYLISYVFCINTVQIPINKVFSLLSYMVSEPNTIP